MGVTKYDRFTDEQNTIAAIAKALGHPARVAIINYLLSVDSCICTDITNALPLSQPTIAQHLQVLHNTGVINGNIEGNAIYYHVDETAIILLQEYLESITSQLT